MSCVPAHSVPGVHHPSVHTTGASAIQGGRPSGGSVRRQGVQHGADLRGGRRSPAEVPARHAGQLELGSLHQASRSQLLVCRVELRGEGRVGVPSVVIRSQRGLSLASQLMHWDAL